MRINPIKPLATTHIYIFANYTCTPLVYVHGLYDNFFFLYTSQIARNIRIVVKSLGDLSIWTPGDTASRSVIGIPVSFMRRRSWWWWRWLFQALFQTCPFFSCVFVIDVLLQKYKLIVLFQRLLQKYKLIVLFQRI